MPKAFGRVASIAAVFALAACGGAKPAAQLVLSVKTEPVSLRTIAQPVELSGSIVPSRDVRLGAAVPGRLENVRVLVGDRLAAGDVVAVLDQSTYRAQVEAASGEVARAQGDRGAAEAEYAAAAAREHLASLTQRRMARLYAEGAVAHQAYDQATADATAARESVEQARSTIAANGGETSAASGSLAAAAAALDETIVRAPFSGVVTQKFADPGTVVAAGTPIVALQDDRNLELDVTLPQDQAGAARVGTAIPVRIDGPNATIVSGRIVSITPMADPAVRSLLMKLAIPFVPGIMSGMYGRVSLPGERARGRAVPVAALVTRAGQSGIFVATGSIATFVPVRTGNSDGRYVLVEGLRDADRMVVVVPTERLTDGTPIDVREQCKRQTGPPASRVTS